MKQAEANVLRAAVQWWTANRPSFWTTADHLAKPLFGVDGHEVALAQAVANLESMRIKRRKKQEKRNAAK